MPDHHDEQTRFPASLSRRAALKVLGAGAVGSSLLAHHAFATGSPFAAAKQPSRVQPAIRPFPLQDVRLLDSPFREAQQRNARYMLELDPDRMLHNFRVNAKLPPKARVYGGWESQQPWVDIRCHGHTLGHYLSAAALMHAATGDARFRERVDYIVDELRACQDASRSGLVCAFPEGGEILENAVQGKPYPGVPWYTMHKVFAGLRDAHIHTGSEAARAVLVRLADWVAATTRDMTSAGFEKMLEREHGGMNEVLADVHELTGDARYLTLARQFSHRALLEPLAARRDPLDGLHANTQIPKVIGFQRLYELTGDSQYRDAARFFWEAVVHTRSFVTGGHGDGEHFFPPSTFGQHLNAKTMETCGSHNMLRLTRMLFGSEAPVAARYADYYERTLYNTILASQDPETGWSTYFQPLRPGYLKFYHTPIDSFWCCTGTGIENHAKYGDSIYFHGDDVLYVNLFIPSELTWRNKAMTIRQTTSFPETDTSRLAIEVRRPVRATLNVRYPIWSNGATVRVNGRVVDSAARPGSYIAIDRTWRNGDVVDVRVPMSLHAEALPGAPDKVAILYGPLVLAGRLGKAAMYPGADIIQNERTVGSILDVPVAVPDLAASAQDVVTRIRPVAGAPLTFETTGIGKPHDVTLIPYHRLHHERYNIYWTLV
jgi:DUF1680 family protein